MRRGLFIGTLFGILLFLSGCSSEGGEKKEEVAAAAKSPAAVETAAVVVSDISQGVDVVGILTPKREAAVKSEYLGVVAEIYVTEWVRVRQGTPLAKLDTREADIAIKKMQANLEMARANLLEAESALARAEREYERSQKLKEYGLITEQNREDAQTAKAAALARLGARQAQLKAAEEDLRQTETRLSKAVIRAPMEGVVSERTVNVGDLVGEPGTPKVMFRIVDSRLLDLVVNVPSHELGMLKEGQTLIFSTDAVPGKNFRGRVKFINPVVSEADRSVKVIAEVPNVPEVLKGGLFVQGKIITSQKKGALQISRSAFTSWEMAGKTGEVLVAENSVARLRKVQTGIAAGEMVEITRGLSAGDRIIVRGGFQVKDGEPVRIVRTPGGK